MAFLDDSGVTKLVSLIKSKISETYGLTRIVANNVSVAASAWVADNTYANYPYKATISFSGATADMIPEVIFDPDDAASGNYAAVADTAANVVYIYAKLEGAVAISIPTIVVYGPSALINATGVDF